MGVVDSILAPPRPSADLWACHAIASSPRFLKSKLRIRLPYLIMFFAPSLTIENHWRGASLNVPFSYRRLVTLHLLLAVVMAAAAPLYAQATPPSGERIYADVCLRCHGIGGAGTEHHPDALEGDLSVRQLTELIAETMPEDDPGSLSPQDAEAVAAYVHGAFYSSIARARNRPARIELTRLTVRQHRLSLTDLIGNFMGPSDPGEERGLRGEYFNTRQPGRRKAAAKRTDALVDFDFGSEAPVEEIEDPGAFSISWRGSIIAPDTGEYEFIVRTEHAARLWINDDRTSLIDAWVKSGDQNEYRASRYLLGGRAYPVKLEFSKAKQGVDDSKKQKTQPPPAPATIRLNWQRPGGIVEPIARERLTPESVAESFICAQSFPPDDRSYGWERGVTVSEAWDQAVTQSAIAAADFVASRLAKIADLPESNSRRAEALRVFSKRFVERAFRRPLSDELVRMYVDRPFEDVENPDAAVRRVVLMALKSPRFLFREVGDAPDAYDVASRLSFGLWDSLPDRRLRDAAASRELNNEEQVRRQAIRMLADSRAKTKLLSFLRTWLRVDAGADLSKDPQKFPEFDATAIADLRTSLDLFLNEIVSSEGSSYRDLLLDDRIYLNQRLARLYEGPAVSDAGFEKIRIDGGSRAGVLTHPYVMAHFAHHRESSPIHRGVFLARGVLGKLLRPPPQAITPLPAELHPDLTTRQRVAEQTKAAECMACHTIINPLGFTLERFDAIGKYRESDNGKPVDDTAIYPLPTGDELTLSGARALAEFLADNEECHAAFIEQLFHHLVQQPVGAYGPEMQVRLRRKFAEHDLNIRALAVEIMTATALVGREDAVPASPAKIDGGELAESHR